MRGERGARVSYAVISCDLDTVDRHLEGFERDGVDARMARHPGMRVPLAEKRARLRDILMEIGRARRVVTYEAALAEGLAA